MSNNGYVLHNGEVMDRAEAELQQELERLKIKNEPKPTECPKCKDLGALKTVSGMVGEPMIICDTCGDVLWTDQERAIRNIY